MTRREGSSIGKRWLLRGVTGAAALLALVSGQLLVPRPATADRQPVFVEGFMPFGFHETAPKRLAVDSQSHRGFYVTSANGPEVHVYDLKKMRRITTLSTAQLGDSFAVDSAHGRVFYRPTQAAFDCTRSVLIVLDTRTLKIRERVVPCYQGTTPYFVRGLSYYAPANKLYVIGATSVESVSTQATGTNNYHESTIIRQLNADTFHLDWEVDASQVCDTNTNIPTSADPVVGRTARGVISYCYVKGQGRAVWIPLSGDQPISESGTPIIHVSPTIGRSTTPIIDQASGRLLILEDNPPFGPAVYVYNPERERFVGVVPSGVSLEHGGTFYDYFRGLSAENGRLYILNRTGLVVADVRADPLPSGVSFPVLQNGVNGIYTGSIGVDSELGRLFFAFPEKGGFVVVHDGEPAARSGQGIDPDAGTADVREEPGVTDTTSAAAAASFGVHILNTGGAPRLVDNTDVFCTATTNVNDRDAYGRCPADQIVTPGDRQYYLSQAGLESGSDSGSGAFAAIERSPASDSATDSDFRGVGRCEADHVSGGGLPDLVASLSATTGSALASACPNRQGQLLEEPAAGTRGSNGKGYPIPGAACTDFDGTPANDSVSQEFGTASTTCDSAKQTASALASSGAVDVSVGSQPALTIARSASSVVTRLGQAGIETVSTAAAYGVSIGSLITVGEIKTTAVTRARGRTGTTKATFDRTFSSVRGPGIDCAVCDPQAVADEINRVFGAQLRARVPAPLLLASPHGYQGVVSKDSGLLQSDRAVNDDDSVTVTGLDLIYYNDSAISNPNGSSGRSRVVVSLAGVEAESRYGIFLLPQDCIDPSCVGGGSSGGDGGGVTSGGGGTAVEGEKITNPVTPGTTPPAPQGAPGYNVLSQTFAFVRTRPGEAGILAMLWLLFAAPVYLGLRRRSLRRALD